LRSWRGRLVPHIPAPQADHERAESGEQNEHPRNQSDAPPVVRDFVRIRFWAWLFDRVELGLFDDVRIRLGYGCFRRNRLL
jgi:hypothetical protein